ncbi:MAG: hypothetical protein NC111_00195 [Bacteroides sp.]|nr:hypothetical protein [Bacteroides sp.]MCM1412770.1 hypothetical protein [Bacteroides sp.]MCM1470936.1 hypothetical protein [Bacteroides sp.]
MTKYNGKPVVVRSSAEAIYDKVSNLSAFQERIDQLPADLRDKMGEVKFSDDRLLINAPGIGEMAFVIVERLAPVMLKMTAENSPVPFNITLNFKSLTDDTTQVWSDIDIEIPAMLRPLISGKMQTAADKFGEMFGNLFGVA